MSDQPVGRLTATRRRGLSLIEVLVVLGILAIVLALVLPAIQGARQRAWGLACTNNLRQIGLAISAYHEVNGCFPQATQGHSARSGYSGHFAMHARMLPFLEQGTLFNQINFQVGATPPEFESSDQTRIQANRTAASTSLAVFLCPADGGKPSVWAGNSYRGNAGISPFGWMNAEHPEGGRGFFKDIGRVSASHVPDGLSSTVAFSERLWGSGRPSATPIPERDFWQGEAWAASPDEILIACALAARPNTPARTSGGDTWFWSGRYRTTYLHAQAPNGEIPDCLSFSVIPTLGMATARSGHPGGVHAVFGDGSARLVQETIDLAVWRALGTRNGWEILPALD